MLSLRLQRRRCTRVESLHTGTQQLRHLPQLQLEFRSLGSSVLVSVASGKVLGTFRHPLPWIQKHGHSPFKQTCRKSRVKLLGLMVAGSSDCRVVDGFRGCFGLLLGRGGIPQKHIAASGCSFRACWRPQEAASMPQAATSRKPAVWGSSSTARAWGTGGSCLRAWCECTIEAPTPL